jgi:hypothetical protein
VANGHSKDKVVRLQYSILNAFTSRNIDLSDITSIEPTPDDFQ